MLIFPRMILFWALRSSSRANHHHTNRVKCSCLRGLWPGSLDRMPFHPPSSCWAVCLCALLKELTAQCTPVFEHFFLPPELSSLIPFLGLPSVLRSSPIFAVVCVCYSFSQNSTGLSSSIIFMRIGIVLALWLQYCTGFQ